MHFCKKIIIINKYNTIKKNDPVLYGLNHWICFWMGQMNIYQIIPVLFIRNAKIGILKFLVCIDYFFFSKSSVALLMFCLCHDDVIKWKHFLCYWPFGVCGVCVCVGGGSTGHWWIALTKASDAELWYFLWSAINGLVSNWNTSDLRCHHAYYDITVMVNMHACPLYSVRSWNNGSCCIFLTILFLSCSLGFSLFYALLYMCYNKTLLFDWMVTWLCGMNSQSVHCCGMVVS